MSRKTPKNAALQSSADNLSHSINELIAEKKNRASTSGTTQYKQKYEVILNTLDRLLQKLPEEQVDDLSVKFQQDVLNKIKQLNN